MSVAKHESGHTGHSCEHGHVHGEAPAHVASGLAKDPVCGMAVDPATAKASAEFAGHSYYFCCAGCRDAFLADPQRYVGEAHAQAPAAHAHGHSAPAAGPATDPVCGMSVDPATAKHSAAFAGETHYFCSASCRDKFLAEPQRYLGAAPAKAAPSAPAGTIYTCPMHPQIRQAGPGSCPICGMALEPETPAAESGPNPELVDMTRRFWVAVTLAIPVAILDMVAPMTSLGAVVGEQALNWLQLVLATPVVLWAGWPFFVRGARSIVSRNLNMFTLIAVGTGVAWTYSVVATVAPGVFPAALDRKSVV